MATPRHGGFLPLTISLLVILCAGHIMVRQTTPTLLPGSAFFTYENTQAAATIWYHDHALGMTRSNVYAGPAGFWLIRGGANDTAAGVLPGPAPSGAGDPNFNGAYRATIREIPIAIQDRSFNTNGSLFYPQNRTFFDGFTGPFIGGTGTPAGPSDISGIWNPEAFFNTIVVNGTTWPNSSRRPGTLSFAAPGRLQLPDFEPFHVRRDGSWR